MGVFKEEVFKEVVSHVASLDIWRKIVFLEALQTISQEGDVVMVVEGPLVEDSTTGVKEKEAETEMCL